MAANITTFQNGIISGDKIGEQWLNECYDEVKDTSTGHYHDGVGSRVVPGTKVLILYTGTGFDESAITGEDNSTSYELSTISSSDLAGGNYLKIKILSSHFVRARENDGAYTYFTIETKEIGGSYSDSMAETLIVENSATSSASTPRDLTFLKNIEWLHTLSANEKTSGIAIRITARCKSDGPSTGEATITNKQVVINSMI